MILRGRSLSRGRVTPQKLQKRRLEFRTRQMQAGAGAGRGRDQHQAVNAYVVRGKGIVQEGT